MFEYGLPRVATDETTHPLALPTELWADFSESQKAACFSGHALIEAFGLDRTLSLNALSQRADLSLSDALEGLRVLDGMDLVSVEGGDIGPVVTLLAKPDDYVRIVTPNHSVRWVFVVRPLEAPHVDPKDLN